jgi:hypothetical protein
MEASNEREWFVEGLVWELIIELVGIEINVKKWFIVE